MKYVSFDDFYQSLVESDFTQKTGNFIKDVFNKAKGFVKSKAKILNKKVNAKKLMYTIKKKHTKPRSSAKFRPGDMYHYQYKAKWAKQLYDTKPLIICLGRPKKSKLSKTHFYGLNLHWMPLDERVAAATYFTELRKKRKGKVTYDDVKPWLNKYKKRKKILRMYIINNVSPKLIEFPETDEFIAVSALRTEKFMWSS